MKNAKFIKESVKFFTQLGNMDVSNAGHAFNRHKVYQELYDKLLESDMVIDMWEGLKFRCKDTLNEYQVYKMTRVGGKLTPLKLVNKAEKITKINRFHLLKFSYEEME